MKNKLITLPIHALLIFGLTFQPSMVQAGNKEYNATCKNNPDLEKYDDIKASCGQAKIAKMTRDLEATKVAIFTAATALTATMAAIEDFPMTAAAAKAVCIGIGIGLPLAAMAADIGVAVKSKNLTGALMGSMTSLASIGMNISSFKGATSSMASTSSSVGGGVSRGVGHQVGTRGADAANRASQAGQNAASKSTNGAQQAACKSTAISMGISTAMSAIGLATAQIAFNKSTDVAAKLKETPGNQLDTKDPNYGYNAGNSAGINSGKPGVQTGPNTEAMTAESCDALSGSAYLKCQGKFDSDIAKMTSDPRFVDTMNKFLGQNLGDFAKNAPREEGKMNDYVASALGMGAAGASELNKMNKTFEQLAKDSGALKYTPSSVASSGSSGSHDMDFNAMMAGMLKQMNPESTAKKDEAAELAFRQMELLPADKLMQNKDISLFARIGFRYRKSSAKVDSLNWALPQNQEASSSENRAPAKN